MNTTIDFKTAKTIEAMNQKINHMDNAVTDFFNKMSDVLERQFGDDEVYAAVIAPEIELTITPLANVRSYLPCFDEADSCYSISEDVPLALCYDPRQVITLAGKRYLSGAVVFVRYDTNGSFVALTTSDLYLIQCYLAENSVPLMAGREKMVCISNTFDIIMAVFDVTQQVVANSSGIISGNTRVNDIGLSMLQSSMMQMDVGPLFGLFLQSFFIGITMRILSIVIFVIVYGRMIEIYMMVSLAPVPMATWGNHEQSHVGQNYLRSLFALGFQGFLILICVAIYAVLLQNVAISGDAINSIWSIVGYTVLLCFSLFKTSSVAKTLLGAH